MSTLPTGAFPGLFSLRLPLSSGYPGPAPLPEPLVQKFAQPRFESAPTKESKEGSEDEPYRRIRLDPVKTLMPVPKEILIDWYHPGGKRRPVVMVLPNLGGGTELSAGFATFFRDHGYAALLVHRENRADVIADFDLIETNLRQVIIDHRQVLDWIETETELDGRRIALFGISTGSVKGALLTAADPRVGAAVLALAGGDVPYILTRTNEPRVREARKKHLAACGLSVKELEGQLRDQVRTDPLQLAPWIDARKVLLVLGLFDRTVPFKKGLELRRTMGRPETLLLPTGHYSAIAYAPYVRHQALGFYRRRFGCAPEP